MNQAPSGFGSRSEAGGSLCHSGGRSSKGLESLRLAGCTRVLRFQSGCGCLVPASRRRVPRWVPELELPGK